MQNTRVSANSPTAVEPISRAHSRDSSVRALIRTSTQALSICPTRKPHRLASTMRGHEPEDGLERLLVRPVLGGGCLLHEPEGPCGQGRHPERQPDRPPRRAPAVDLGEHVADHVHQREQERPAVGDQRPDGDQLRRPDVGDQQQPHEDRHHGGVVPGGARVGRAARPPRRPAPPVIRRGPGGGLRGAGARVAHGAELNHRREPHADRVGVAGPNRDRVGFAGTRSPRIRRDSGQFARPAWPGLRPGATLAV